MKNLFKFNLETLSYSIGVVHVTQMPDIHTFIQKTSMLATECVTQLPF